MLYPNNQSHGDLHRALRVHCNGIMYLNRLVARGAGALSGAGSPDRMTALQHDRRSHLLLSIGVIAAAGWAGAFLRGMTVAESWLNVFIYGTVECRFHGGLDGSWFAGHVFCPRHSARIPRVSIFLAPLPGNRPDAGRIGNFINVELWGNRPICPWAFGVPDAQGVYWCARHPRIS